MRHWLVDTSETDAVTRVASAGLTRPRDFDDLAAPQAVISSDRIRKLYPRKLCLLQAAATVSDCREQGGQILLLTIAPKVVSFVLGPEYRVVVPVYDVLYLLIGRLQQTLPA